MVWVMNCKCERCGVKFRLEEWAGLDSKTIPPKRCSACAKLPETDPRLDENIRLPEFDEVAESYIP